MGMSWLGCEGNILHLEYSANALYKEIERCWVVEHNSKLTFATTCHLSWLELVLSVASET